MENPEKRSILTFWGGGGGGHVDRVKLKPRKLFHVICDRLGTWVLTEKAQYVFFCAFFGLFSITA